MGRGEVRYRLVLDSKGFTDGIKAAKNEANAMANDMSSKLGRAGNVLSAMGPAGLAAAAGLGALAAAGTAALKATIEASSAAAKYADAMAALEDKTGLSSKALQDLEVAAKLGNSSLDAVSSAVNKMQINLVNGSKEFQKLGLSIAEMKKQSPEQQFKTVSTAILSLGTAAERTAASKALLGKSATELIGTMKAAASGATELGGALKDHALKASADMQDEMDLLDTAMERVKLQFGAAINQSPELQKAITGITEIMVVLAKTIQNASPDIAKFFDGLISGAKRAAPVIEALTSTGMLFGIPGIAMSLGAGKVAGSSAFQDALLFSDVNGGGSSTGNDPKGGRKYSGSGDDQSKAAAERRAKEIADLMQKVRDLEVSKWKDFLDKESGLAVAAAPKIAEILNTFNLKMLQEQVGNQTELAKVIDPATGLWTRYADVVQEELANASAPVEASITNTEKWAIATGNVAGIVDELAGALQQMGISADSTLGKMVSGFQDLAHAAQDGVSSFGKFASGNIIGGTLDGIRAIGGLVGGIKKLFGGKSKEEKAAEEAARQKKITDTISQMQGLMDKAKNMKMDMLTKGVSGLAAMFGHLGGMADVSGSRLERLGRFGGEMLAQLRAQGLSTVEAFKVMGPALDKALEALQKNGGAISGTFGALLDFRSKVQDNESLVGAVEGFNDLMSSMALNKDSIRDVQDEMGALFDEMTGKGFTSDQALSLIAPTLLRIRDAARDGRVTIDEETQAMIDAAEAGGHFENLKDPMQELVEVQKMMLELWSAIAHMQGVTLPASLQEYINTLHQAQSAQGAAGAGVGMPGGGGGVHSDFPTHEGETGHAASGLHTILGRGPLSAGGTPLVGHPGEEVYIGPRGGRPRGPMGGGAGQIVLTVDGKVWAEHNIQNLRRNRYGSASQTRRHLGR